MKFYINGLKCSPAAALACLSASCDRSGTSLADALPDGLATAQSEWGRDYIAELSGYVLECQAEPAP